MKKKALFVFVIILATVLCVSAWFYGYYNRKSNDNIPSKELMVSYCQNQGVDYAAEQLQGYKYTQLIEVWGEPDSSLSGMWGDIWETNNTYNLIVYYDHNGIVERVSVFDKGIITRHLKNGANLHQTAVIEETQSGGFFRDMAGVHWGPPYLG